MTSCGNDTERQSLTDQPAVTLPLSDTCQAGRPTNDDDEAADQVPELPGDVDELTPPLPPDGGWGWAVVAASFTANLILDGVCYTFGVLMPELLRHFQAGKGKTALVGSMLPGCYLLVGKPCYSCIDLQLRIVFSYRGI